MWFSQAKVCRQRDSCTLKVSPTVLMGNCFLSVAFQCTVYTSCIFGLFWSSVPFVIAFQDHLIENAVTLNVYRKILNVFFLMPEKFYRNKCTSLKQPYRAIAKGFQHEILTIKSLDQILNFHKRNLIFCDIPLMLNYRKGLQIKVGKPEI